MKCIKFILGFLFYVFSVILNFCFKSKIYWDYIVGRIEINIDIFNFLLYDIYLGVMILVYKIIFKVI